MDDEFTAKILPVHVDRRLDELLVNWAEHIRLSPMEKDELYDRIFVISKDLGYDWWRQLLVDMPLKNSNIFANLWYGHKKNAV